MKAGTSSATLSAQRSISGLRESKVTTLLQPLAGALAYRDQQALVAQAISDFALHEELRLLRRAADRAGGRGHHERDGNVLVRLKSLFLSAHRGHRHAQARHPRPGLLDNPNPLAHLLAQGSVQIVT